MAEILFKSSSSNGLIFSRDEFSIGNAIHWMEEHISNIQSEIDLVTGSADQQKINSSQNTLDYTLALNDYSRLNFTLTLGDDFNLNVASDSGYDTNITFKNYNEANTGTIGTGINGSISFKEIDIDIEYNNEGLYQAQLFGDFSIDTFNNNADLFSNLSQLNFNSYSGEEISYKGNLTFTSQAKQEFTNIFDYLTRGSDIIYGTSYSDEIHSGSGNDSIYSYGGNDYVDGGSGIDTLEATGEFSDYSFIRTSKALQSSDKRFNTNSSHDGIDTLKNIEYIQFSDQKVEESKVDVIKTFNGNFSDYKFYNKAGSFLIETQSGYDDITGYPRLTFTGEAMTSSFREVSAIADIKETFDQVTGLNSDSGRIFRLYNASFKRLPDSDGLRYWIDNFSSGRNTIRVIASSFLGSAEFKQRYGQNVSDTTFVNNLYKNVLGRDADISGLNYWLGQLSSGAETRYDALLGFAESIENKQIFSEMTGYF